MDRLMGDKSFIGAHKCPTYQPFPSDYVLTTAEVYKQFIVRLVEGSVGIHAITLMQTSTLGPKFEHPLRLHTLPSWTDSRNELSSWVPNLSGGDACRSRLEMLWGHMMMWPSVLQMCYAILILLLNRNSTFWETIFMFRQAHWHSCQ